MVIEWDPRDRIFVVTVPEISGCRTHGKTYEEAVRNGREIIELCVDSMRELDEPLPSFRSFHFQPDIYKSDQSATPTIPARRAS
jgi:predicted RNase H-like HicB family nuclease